MSLLLRAAGAAGLRQWGNEAGALWSRAQGYAATSWVEALTAGPRTGCRAHSSAATPTDDSASTGPSPGAAAAAAATAEGEAEDVGAIERFRAAKRFRRRADGRVLLYGKEHDNWLEAKLDGYVEGSLLLLAPEGRVYYLVSEDLKQIDLSNDQLVGQLFGEGGWEPIMQPLYTQTSDGELKHVKMTPQQFRSIFTVLKEAPPPAAVTQPPPP